MSSKETSPVLTAAKQTMDAWSRVIASRQQIPAIYQPAFNALFAESAPFPYVILTPLLDKYPRKPSEKLVCDSGDILHILENNDGQIITTSFAYPDLCSLEVGSVLLDSWLTLQGTTTQGALGSVTLHLNTTSLRYFAEIIARMRPQPDLQTAHHFSAQKDKFNELSGINFKFMNYARESLVPGETVLHMLYQPEIRRSLWPPLGMLFSRTVSPAHLLILTDRELILIQDVERSSKSKAQYGAIWHYLPLRRLRALTTRPATEQLVLSIEGKAFTFERIFDATLAPQLEEFCTCFQTLAMQTLP